MKKQLTAKRLFVNPIYQDKATVLKTSSETGGAYTEGELEVAPGGGNFMHTHSAFEEIFTAVKGVLGVTIKNRKYFLKPGESITIPLHTPHHFFNAGTESLTCRVKFIPGHEDFVKGIAIAYGLATDGKTNSKGIPKNFMHLALVMVLTDTKPTGPLGMAFPFIKWLANRAKRNGTEKELLEKYYFE
jgi:mannose-6-phosphate isomerase-like protein (cupin superfamily)